MQNANELDKAQVGIKIGRRNINNLRYADDTTLMAESEEQKSFLIRMEEGSEKAGQHGIWSHHFMANKGEKVGTVTHFFSWAPKSQRMFTAAMKLKDACSLEEKLWQT